MAIESSVLTTAEQPSAAALDPEERLDLLLRDLGTRRAGLSVREAERRLQHGPNRLERRRSAGHGREIVRQLTHPLAALLWAATALALVAGLEPIAIAIVVVILLNAAFAFVQELQAERATEALQAYLAPHARVRRDGRTVDIEASGAEAAAWFVKLTGGRAAIGSLAEAAAVLDGRSGTTIVAASDHEVGRLDQVA